MSFEEEFDKIIRRKSEETEYPFDQSSWEKASSLLDAERKVTGILRFKRFYLPAALTLIIGSAGFVAYSFLSDDSTSNNIALQQKIESEVSPTTPSTEQNTAKLIAETDKTEMKKSNQATINPQLTEEHDNQKSKNENDVEAKLGSKNSMTDAKASKIKTSIISQKELESQLVKTKASVKTQEPLESAIVETKNTPLGIKKSPENQITKEPTKNNSVAFVNKDKSSLKDSESQNKDANVISKELAPLIPTNNDEPVKQKDSDKFGERIASDVKETQMDAKTVVAYQEEILVVNAEKLQAVHSLIPMAFEENSLKPTEFIYLKRYDDDYYKNSIAPKKHYLNFGLGANYLLGWDASNGKDGQGFNWFAGFNYGRYLSRKIDVSLGIQAYNIANIKQPFYLISEKEYGFGSTEVYTRVTTSQLYYLALPLAVNYAINSNNTIGLGINAAYLLNAKSNVAKYYLLDNEEKTISKGSSDGMGIYKGTKMTNLMLSAHYKTQLSKRVGLNLECNYGLTDIFQNEGTIKTKESPIGIRLGLNYTLFDK